MRINVGPTYFTVYTSGSTRILQVGNVEIQAMFHGELGSRLSLTNMAEDLGNGWQISSGTRYILPYILSWLRTLLVLIKISLQ